jgi:hypothetical protein
MEYEYPQIPITVKDVKQILKEVGRGLSPARIQNLITALNVVKLDLERFTPRHKQLEKLKKMKAALEHILMNLDPSCNDVLLSAGHEYAEKYGAPSGSSFQSVPAYDYYTLEELDNEVIDVGTHDRLRDLEQSAFEVLMWISLAVEGPFPRVEKMSSYKVRIVGAMLPEVYERIFNVRFKASLTGPGTRFIQAILAKMPEYFPEILSPETIIKYRHRMKKTEKLARAGAEKERLRKNSDDAQ